MTKVTGSIFNDDEGVAEVLNIKAALFELINAYIEDHNLTQAAAARCMCVAQSQINKITKGRIGGVSLDCLVAITARVDMNVIYVARC